MFILLDLFFLILASSANPNYITGQWNAEMCLNSSWQCVGRCSLYLLASAHPSLAAPQCISRKGFLTRQAATGQHIVKDVGVWRVVRVWGGGVVAPCTTPPTPHCEKALCGSPAISLPGMGLSRSARFRGQEAGRGKCE